tara:strand:+ start:8194 stop:10386 length:2193 start_codon:yes stop_codon:yes gene_type:complete
MDEMNKKVSEEIKNPEIVQQEAELQEQKNNVQHNNSEQNPPDIPPADASGNHQDDKAEADNSDEEDKKKPEASTDPPQPEKEELPQKQDADPSDNAVATKEPVVEAEENQDQKDDSPAEEPESKKTDTAEESEADESKTGSATSHDSHEHDDHDDEIPDLLSDVDLDHASKKELFELLKKHSHLDHMRTLDHGLKELKPHYDTLYDKEKEVALKAFIDNGGAEVDFEYKGDDIDRGFYELYDLLREKRHKFYVQLEKDKEENLKRKNEILEELRELVDGEESTASINKLKELQTEWKKIGHVPGQYVKSLWANYNALIDRYYDHRSIYFELKELDRQKNLKGKLELCERAEALDKLDNIKSAITELNELHEEFKHIGPIPREDQEPVWQRFKAASDKIYAKRKDFYDEVRKDQEKNMEAKKQLGDQAAEFTKFDSDRITEWNQKTREILELQKKWEKIGSLPREHAKEVNKHFWGNFKEFFNNKNNFFKKLEGMREENLKKKQELLERALAIKDSEEWEKTANTLKTLQSEWRDIGPVPEKFRNEVYKQFKAACDHFFERKRGKNQERNQEFEENLKKKEAVCDQLETVLNSDTIKLDEIYDLLDQYAEIGFVPRQSIKAIHGRFDSITNQLISLEELSEDQRNELKTQVQVNKLKGSPHGGQKINRKENAIKRKISAIESDITTWKNNLEFFANSKTADKLKDDFKDKISSAEKELDTLKKQLDVLHHS